MIILSLLVLCGFVIFSNLCHLVVSLIGDLPFLCQDQLLESRGYDCSNE